MLIVLKHKPHTASTLDMTFIITSIIFLEKFVLEDI